MTLRTPVIASVALAAAVLLILPADAQAQRRGSVRVGVAVGRSVGVGVRVGRPRVYVSSNRYGPYYSAYDPFFYDSWYYSPYAQIYPRYGYRYDDSSSLRLEVKPRNTEVFVDGYFAGTVDDFDGLLQRLYLEPGDHDIELYLAGHRTHVQRVYLQPTKTFRIRHDMAPLAAGDPPSVRPNGQPLPVRDDEDAAPRRGAGPRDSDPRDPQGRARDPRDQDRDRDPQPRARTAESGFGSLALRVQPGDAEVLIDGEKWQGSGDERLVVQLGGGVHRLQISKDGYRTYMTDVTVRAGETTPLNVAMTKQ